MYVVWVTVERNGLAAGIFRIFAFCVGASPKSDRPQLKRFVPYKPTHSTSTHTLHNT